MSQGRVITLLAIRVADTGKTFASIEPTSKQFVHLSILEGDQSKSVLHSGC